MIYISISCFGYDSELKNTLDTAFLNAKNPNNINIGIAFTGNKDFYKEIKNQYPIIKAKYFEYEENMGVGSGRLSALSMYENEKYFLQIDSHNNFVKNWDELLINKFELAKERFNSNKIVFSGCLPGYEYLGKKIFSENVLEYPIYEKNAFLFNSIPSFYSEDIYNIKPLYDLVKTTGFAPLTKIHGFFIFGSSELANNLGIEKDIVFWEEEIIQSINLIDSGFILVYPGEESPMSHYHIKNKKTGGRQSVFQIYPKATQLMIHNYYKFILNPSNQDKIRRYEEYVNLNLITGPKEENFYPKNYINHGV